MKGTGAKRNVCPGSYVTTGAKFPVAPVESAPMAYSEGYERFMRPCEGECVIGMMRRSRKFDSAAAEQLGSLNISLLTVISMISLCTARLQL